MVVVPQTAEHYQQGLAFMAARGVEISPSDDLRLIAHADANEQVDAVVAFNGFTHRIASIHVVGDGGKWIDRQMLRVVFDYAFNHCKLVALYGQVASNNERAMRLDLHLGFREVTRLRDAVADGVDLVILEMRRDECRWLKDRRVNHGIEIVTAAA